MPKDFNIHAIYDGQSHIFQCPQKEFLKRAAEFYNIDALSVDLYIVGRDFRRRILSEYEIGDLMKVEIVPKGARMEQRNLRSCGGEPSGKEAMVQRIVEKLKNNNVLNGHERKHLLDMLQDCSKNSGARKRKLDDDSNGPKRIMIHKKVQVHPSAHYLRDMFTQTDCIAQNGGGADVDNNDNDDDYQQAGPSNAGEQQKSDEAIVRIKKLAGKDKVNKQEVKQLMDETFDARRHLILMDTPLVAAVKDKYPLLFSVDEVKNELERMFYPGKCDEFLENINKYSNVILSNCDPANNIYARTKKSVGRAKTEEQRRYATAVGSILLIPELMKESLGFLNLLDNECQSDNFPYINASLHALKDIFFDNILFTVITEQRELCEASNFKEAILCLMASFFIFNINYPETCEQSLILFEKLYLCANDTPDALVVGDTQQMIKFLKLKANAI